MNQNRSKGYTIVEDMDITEDDELFKVKYNGNWKAAVQLIQTHFTTDMSIMPMMETPLK